MGSLLRSAANLRTLLVLSVTLGVISAQAGAGTLAVFTDTATSTGNTFQTGTVNLQLKGADVADDSASLCNTTTGYADTLSHALFGATGATGATPGTVRTEALCATNVGTLGLSWALTTSSLSDDTDTGHRLRDDLNIRIYNTGTGNKCEDGLTTAGGTTGPTGAAASGYANILGATGIASIGASGATGATGSVGAFAGATGATGATQKLCISTALPSSISDDLAGATGATIQGKTVTGSFSFTGTQNP